jgi:3-oxoadipate enol-lactonase
MKNVILFVHGFPLHRGMWTGPSGIGQLEAVRDAGWTPIAPNLPGFAGAPALQHASMDSYADHVQQSLVTLGFDQAVDQAVIVGLSMGGYIAFRLLERFPNLARALVLADTRATPDSPEQVKNRLALADRVEREGMTWLADSNVVNLVAESAGQDVRSSLREMHLAASVVGTAAASRAMAFRPDSTPMLEKIKIPTLIVVGEHDKPTPVASSEDMHARIKGSKLEVIKNAAHMSNLEQPKAFNRVLLEFLKSL